MTEPTIAYGIKNCDTIKKMKKWLDAENIPYTFHDYRVDGINKEMLETFIAALGWESLINKRGTTYRQLTDEQKAGLDQASAIKIMLDNPAIIKRPVLLHNHAYHLGFKPEQYQAIFTQQ
ncbi:TPA: ArsC family reductase [Photobacterium damselae]